jgi:hypothetical protein
MAGNGGSVRIIVTQPRRIAAISVAERVAAERGERGATAAAAAAAVAAARTAKGWSGPCCSSWLCCYSFSR